VEHNTYQPGASLSLLSVRQLQFINKENSVTSWIHNFYLKKTIKYTLRVERPNIYKSEIVDMENEYVLYRREGNGHLHWRRRVSTAVIQCEHLLSWTSGGVDQHLTVPTKSGIKSCDDDPSMPPIAEYLSIIVSYSERAARLSIYIIYKMIWAEWFIIALPEPLDGSGWNLAYRYSDTYYDVCVR